MNNLNKSTRRYLEYSIGTHFTKHQSDLKYPVTTYTNSMNIVNFKKNIDIKHFHTILICTFICGRITSHSCITN